MNFTNKKLLRFAYFDCDVLRSHVGPSVTCLKHDPPINKRLMNDIGAAPTLGSYLPFIIVSGAPLALPERSASLANRQQQQQYRIKPPSSSYGCGLLWCWYSANDDDDDDEDANRNREWWRDGVVVPCCNNTCINKCRWFVAILCYCYYYYVYIYIYFSFISYTLSREEN